MAGLQHHQKPQHKNLGSRPGTPPELLSSTAVREHCHNLPQPYRILSLPKPPKLHTWTGITQNSMAGPRHLQSGALPKLPPTPQTRMKAPTKTSQSQTTTGITQSPGQDHGITKISNLHPGRTRALPKLLQSHIWTRTIPKPPNPTREDCGIIKTPQSQTRTGIINSPWQECGSMKIFRFALGHHKSSQPQTRTGITEFLHQD